MGSPLSDLLNPGICLDGEAMNVSAQRQGGCAVAARTAHIVDLLPLQEGRESAWLGR